MSLLEQTFFLHDTCFQKQLDQLDEFLLQEHEEYETQLFQFPKIQQKIDVLHIWRLHKLVSYSCSFLCEHLAPHLDEWVK